MTDATDPRADLDQEEEMKRITDEADSLRRDYNGLPFAQWSLGSITVSPISTLGAELSSSIQVGDTVVCVTCPSQIETDLGRRLIITDTAKATLVQEMQDRLAVSGNMGGSNMEELTTYFRTDESRLCNAFSDAFVSLMCSDLVQLAGCHRAAARRSSCKEEGSEKYHDGAEGGLAVDAAGGSNTWISSFLLRSEQVNATASRHFVITFDGDMEPFPSSDR
jgi:hypothetical protein